MGKEIRIPKSMLNKIEGKLRMPLHINYISNNITKRSLSETKEILNKLIEEGVVIESEISKDFYSLNTKN